MSYSTDYLGSARRHLQAAAQLNLGKRRDVAGYLYGLAAEMALKHAMRISGMRPGAAGSRDPFFAHFPILKTLLQEQAQGRCAGRLRKVAEDCSFMKSWRIEMRYAPAQDIKKNMDRSVG